MRTGQILQFPLTRGLDEDGNEKAHPVATLKSGNNIRWPKEGTIGKRWGAKELGNFSANQGRPIVRFLPRRSEISAVRTFGEISVYDSVNQVVSGITAQTPLIQLDWSTVVDDETGVACTDAVISGSIVVHAWVSGDPTRLTEATPVPTTSGNLYVQVINRLTGQVLVMPQRIAVSDVQHVRVLLSTFSGNKAFVLFSAGATIRYVCVDIDALTVGSPATLKSDRVVYSDHAIYGKFDAIVKSNASIAFVYERNTTASSAMAAVNCSVAAGTLTVTSTVNYSSDGTWLDAKAISIAEDVSGQQIVIAYFRSNTVRVRSIDVLTLAAVATATTVATPFYASQVALRIIFPNTVSIMWSGYETGSSRLPYLATETWTVSSGSVVATTRTKRRSMGYGLASRPFSLNGDIYVFAVDGRDAEDDGNTNSRTTYPSTYMLKVPTSAFSSSISGYPPHPLGGKIDHDIGGIFQNGTLPSVLITSDNFTAYGFLPFQADAASKSWNWRTGLRLVRATYDTSLIKDPWRSVTIGQESYIAGAYLAAWDGRTVFDYGMRTVDVVLVQEAGANTGHIANGTYVYQFGPGYRSRAGVLHRGPLSDQVTLPIESGPSSSATIKLCSHGPDGKQTETTGFANAAGSSSFVDVFRTEANGSNLYQLSMAPRYNVIVNDPTAATIDLTDTAWDSDIGLFSTESPNPGTIALSSRPEPYTATGELEDCQPPASVLMHLHNGRIFLVIGDRRTIWYSKDFRENPGIAPGFNPVQIELYDQDITALASLDEKRIIFWERGLWYVYGEGPAVDGTDNRFAAPMLIQSDVGCTNPRSVVTTPMGVIFQSDTDLYLLQRNLTVTWLGKDVRDTLASYPKITSAILVAAENEIRFTCNNTGGTAAVILVFDYLRNVWFTRSYGASTIGDATLIDGVYYFAQGTSVWYEDTTVNYDVISSANTFVASTVELEPLGPSGPIGWQRVRVAKMLGQALSNHALTMSFSRDFATTYEQTETFDAGSAVTTPGGHMRAEVALTVQRRQAVGIKLTDAAPANTTLYPIGNGAGFQLEGIALLVQHKPGLPRDTSSRRGG